MVTNLQHLKQHHGGYITSGLDMDYIMEHNGYSVIDMEWRVHYQNMCSHAKNMSNKRLLRKDYIDKIIVGSQREGIALPYTSDVDVMQINDSVCCLTDVTCVPLTTEKNVFQVIRERMPAGYCKLKLFHVGHEERFHDIDYAITKHENKSFLSSSKYIKRNEDFNNNSKTIVGRMTKYGKTQGPSLSKQIFYSDHENRVRDAEGIPIQIENGDFVKALPCKCPDILQRWCGRNRLYNWPTSTTVAAVAALPSHVVPVGSKYSSDSDIQWRICYTLAEIYLVQSFGNMQTKAYAILKNIAKKLLPENDLVTSYVIKNIMFWISEEISTKNMSLMELVEEALICLQKCIQYRQLRNYMIPERNLFEGNLDTTETDAIDLRISSLLQDFCSLEISKSVDNYFDSFGKTLYLMERVHQLKVQMLTDSELINVLEYYSTCTNAFTYSLMDKVLDGKYLQRYNLSGLKNPFDIPMKQRKVKLNLNTSKVGLEEVSCMDKCKFVLWIVGGLFFYFLYYLAARMAIVQDRECHSFHYERIVPQGPVIPESRKLSCYSRSTNSLHRNANYRNEMSENIALDYIRACHETKC